MKTDENELNKDGAQTDVIPASTGATKPDDKAQTSDDIRDQIIGLDPEFKERETPPNPEIDNDETKNDSKDSNVLRKLRKELAAKESELRDLRKGKDAPIGQTPAAGQPPTSTEVKPDNTPANSSKPSDPPPMQNAETRRAENEKAFVILERAARALDGEIVKGFDNPEQAREVHQLALEVVRSMSPEELVEIQKRAEAGQLGAASKTISDLVSKELATVLGRTHVQETKARQVEERAQEMRTKISGVMEQVHQKYPSLRPIEGKNQTAELKFATEWFQKNVGTDKDPGIFFPAIEKDPMVNIPRLFDRMMEEFNASHNATAAAERDALRRRLGESTNPEGTNRPGSGGAELSGSAEILAKLRSNGVEVD